MRQFNRSVWCAAVAACLATGLGVSPALGQHTHGAEVKVPETFATAVRDVLARAKEIEAAIKKGDLAAAHEESDAVGVLAKSLGALALRKDSGVPREKVKVVNVAGKALAGHMDAIHEAEEKKDAAAAKAAMVLAREQITVLEGLLPATYSCPMHCDGSKTYDKPGKCPVCEMALKKLTSDKFTVEVAAADGGEIVAGSAVKLKIAMKDPTGRAVAKFDTVHEKLLHLLIVTKDLGFYAHEHPEIQPDGSFVLTYTFPAGGDYVLFHDFTPPGVGQQVVQVPVSVEGPRSEARFVLPAGGDAGTAKTVDGYAVSLDTGGPIKTGETEHLTYTVTKDGKPVTDLQPYLGAMGHLVIISGDLQQFVHSHPHDHAAHGEKAKDAKLGGGGPKVEFEAFFTAPGLYQSWAQFQHGGKVFTVPVTLNVEKGMAGEAKPHSHSHEKK